MQTSFFLRSFSYFLIASAMSIAGLLASTGPAYAGASTVTVSPGAPTAATSDEGAAQRAHDWSFSAGMRLFRTSLPIPIGGLGGLSSYQYYDAPAHLALGFEHHLNKAISLTFALEGGFGESSVGDEQAGGSRSRRVNGSVAVGANIRLARVGPVEVGMTTSLAAGFVQLSSVVSSNAGELDTHVDGWNVGAAVGLLVDIQLIEQLWLRLSTPLLELTYSESTTTSGSDEPMDGSNWQAGLSVAPSIGLRVDF